jgi:hypothetical protein
VTPRHNLTVSQIIATPTLFAIAVVVVILSLRVLTGFAANADVYDLAASLEQGTSSDVDYLARFIATHHLDAPLAGCNDTLTRASVTINLAVVDAADRRDDIASSHAALNNAIEAVKRRLFCNPLDGNAWLRYATLAARANRPTELVIDLLRLSYWTAPSEAWVLLPRLNFATKFYLAGVSGFDAEYDADLRRYVANAPINQVAMSYVASDPRLRPRLRPLIAAEPDLRGNAIVAEIDRLGVDFEAR